MSKQEKIETIQEYYANLLILQYRNKDNAKAEIKTMAELYLVDGLVFDIQDVLDIDNAVGKQLDIIGNILGCSRNIAGFTIDKKYFSFKNATTPYGFSYEDTVSEGFFKQYNNSINSVYSLSDNDFRVLLKFKAIYNLRRGSWYDLDYMYYQLFNDDIELINNKNLTVTFNVKQNASIGLNASIYCGYIKPPLGIGYNFNYI